MKLFSKIMTGLGIVCNTLSFAQSDNMVITGAPFLRISPDARAGSMGDQGVSTFPDGFSQYWNPAKFAFATHSSSVAISYTPWMGKLVNDTFLLYGSYATFLGEEKRSAVSTSIYYFNMGDVPITSLRADGAGVIDGGVAKPNEFAIDLAYSLKLAEEFSMAVTGRYIRSDLGGGFNSNSVLKPANTFAVDISGYYFSSKHISFNNYEGGSRAGFSIQNIGPKLDYSGDENTKSYLPTMARLGLGYDIYFDEQNRLGFTGEASKILVPGIEQHIDEFGITRTKIPNVAIIEGIKKSFSDGIESIMYSLATEYSYDRAFAIRAGYFYESPKQGARQYATLGIGFKYQSFGLDISYLINTSNINTALDNTLRFGLTWNLGKENNDLR